MKMNLEYLRWSIGALSRPSWTHCGFERKLTHEKATRFHTYSSYSRGVDAIWGVYQGGRLAPPPRRV